MFHNIPTIVSMSVNYVTVICIDTFYTFTIRFVLACCVDWEEE